MMPDGLADTGIDSARNEHQSDPVSRSTTRIAERTVAIVPCPGKTESPTTQRPGPRMSEPTARKLLLARETGAPPTAPSVHHVWRRKLRGEANSA